jgi:hypothetical protein
MEVGLPLTSGPIAVFLALEHGAEFARDAASGSLAGTTAEACFAVAYAGLAARKTWPTCLLGGVVAVTRPLVEAGLADSKLQIGLSGRTVAPKLIITLGVSGAVQFVAGMSGSETIIAINSDPNASIFDVAHYGMVGDVFKIVPELIKKIKTGGSII